MGFVLDRVDMSMIQIALPDERINRHLLVFDEKVIVVVLPSVVKKSSLHAGV